MKELNHVIKGCVNNDRTAQAELYNHFASTLYAICLRYCAHKHDAEDCLHDGFVKVFSKIGSYGGNGSFEGWMKRIIINICIDKYRKSFEFVTLEDENLEEEEPDVNMVNDDEKYLIEAIQALPPKYRAVFNLYAIEDLKHKEIAEKLGISEGTSRSNYLRAKKILVEKISYLKSDGRQVKAYC